jgi:hypothetical protein
MMGTGSSRHTAYRPWQSGPLPGIVTVRQPKERHGTTNMLMPCDESNGMTPMVNAASTNTAPSRTAHADGRRRYEVLCTSCGFGGVVTRPPERCPMCGGSSWLSPALRAGRPPAPWTG